MRGQLVVGAVWVALLVVALCLYWPVGWPIFFAFAAGERWGIFWTERRR